MDLAQTLMTRKELPIEEAVDMILQTCDALAEVHARGMVHRRADGTTELAPPFRMADHPFVAERVAPAQGEHTRDILRAAGYDEARIDALVAAGVLRAIG